MAKKQKHNLGSIISWWLSICVFVFVYLYLYICICLFLYLYICICVFGMCVFMYCLHCAGVGIKCGE